MFLQAFGTKLQTSTGTVFTGIVEAVPVSVDTGGGFVEGVENYVTIKKAVLVTADIKTNTVLIIDSEPYVVYHIVDDLSGMVDVYYRTQKGQSYAEDY